jgi:acetyl esterase/lipase
MKYKILILLLLVVGELSAQEMATSIEPIEYTYKIVDSDSLNAYVFMPQFEESKEERPAIVIFHGGGWAMGEPAWGFGYGTRFAKLGLISIVVQYRLSDEKSITPIEAMEDARDLILWARENAKELRLNRDSIVAYGWSAGAHLAASSAVFPSYKTDYNISSIPNALILHSPALSIVNDGWFKKLLLDRGDPITYSPAENIKGSLPPSIIVVGKEDTVTPVMESELFHSNMLKYNNTSYLYIYDGVGHLFTPSDQPDNRWPNPDKEVSSKAFSEIDLFLKKLGYIE